MFKKNKFLFLSVFAHLIIIYVVTQSVMFPSAIDSPVKQPEIIQATLVFDLPPLPKKQVVDLADEAKPQPVEPQKVIPADEPPIESLIEPEAAPEIPLPPISLPQPSIEEKLPPETEQNEEVSESIMVDKNSVLASTSTTNTSEMRSSRSSMVKRHLKSFQQLQQNNMAEQASRNYQKRKNSPVINGQVQDPFMTEDEKIRESFKVRADCSSASKQTTAVVLGFLGAQIDCSKPPPISGFIQDRINKKSHLPSQNQQAEQKIPQSVVIKK